MRAGASGPSRLQIYLDLWLTFQAGHLSVRKGCLRPLLKKSYDRTLTATSILVVLPDAALLPGSKILKLHLQTPNPEKLPRRHFQGLLFARPGPILRTRRFFRSYSGLRFASAFSMSHSNCIYFNRAPFCTSSINVATAGVSPSPRLAAQIIPCDISPRIFRGLRFATTTTLRPTSFSGS